MNDALTASEEAALQAESLPAFGGFSLRHARRMIEQILGLIGRNGIFAEYTVHDFSHILAMTDSLNWIVPDSTKRLMTPADWLLTVLSLYFHDLGMLVTDEEFAHRNASGFHTFCDTRLFGGPGGPDYKARVFERYPDDAKRDRFLYQEFVRAHHADRVANWIHGAAPQHLGVSEAAMLELTELLRPLSSKFRDDLAIVCASHHQDDLDNSRKYRISEPYGRTPGEAANVQYAALLLRTADLLHITSDRAPSVLFRLISPSDPISQEEWAKQNAVRSVRPQLGKGPDGSFSADAKQDTIEVFATFNQVEGFFGLTTYLNYAALQLRLSHDWCAASQLRLGALHEFPWRAIDLSNIEARGFIPQPFSFEVDKNRILDLLTGHTLYNDTGVVLRELIQNSLDAVRLQRLMEPDGSQGHVQVRWLPDISELTVSDTGTGMTQQIIERHLLRVGSSRYQAVDFQQSYPSFSPISRFGIGILSCFMVADHVDILTVHPDEPTARHLTLRSVHGQYLISLLDKNSDERVIGIGPHGTVVKLRLRPSAELGDILGIIRKWVVFPGCPVRVQIGSDEPVTVGYDNPRDALLSIVSRLRAAVDLPATVDVETVTSDGVAVSYVVGWSPVFEDWELVSIPNYSLDERHGLDPEQLPLGFCVEGIRVSFSSPGYDSNWLLGVCNASGPRAPRTNVARSAIETTPEFDAALTAVYRSLGAHATQEAQRLQSHGHSLSWATNELRYLVARLLGDPVRPDLLQKEISSLPLVLIEESGRRIAIAPVDFERGSSFWTIESRLLRSAEDLIRESTGNATLKEIVEALGAPTMALPSGPLVTNASRHDHLAGEIFQGREIDCIAIHRLQRRVDLRWTAIGSVPRWFTLPTDVYRRAKRHVHPSPTVFPVAVATADVKTEGCEEEHGILLPDKQLLLLHGSPLATLATQLLQRADDEKNEETLNGLLALLERLFSTLTRLHAGFDSRPRESTEVPLEEAQELNKMLRMKWRIFDPWAWEREEWDPGND